MTTSQKLKQQLADAQEQARENLQYQASLKDAIATAQKREQAEAAEQQRLATVAARSESVRKLAELVPRINQSSSQFQKMLLEARAIAAEAGRHDSIFWDQLLGLLTPGRDPCKNLSHRARATGIQRLLIFTEIRHLARI